MLVERIMPVERILPVERIFMVCRENFGVEKIMARRENEWGGEKTYYLPSTREPSGELYHERTKGFSK